MTVQIVLPAVSDDEISNGLRALTKRLEEVHNDPQGYGLGGRHGYGYDFENDVFLMFPFYWGDCTCGHETACWEWESEHDHTDHCWHSIYRHLNESYGGYSGTKDWTVEDWQKFGWSKDTTRGIAIYCDCGKHEEWLEWIAEHDHDADCPSIRPNFLHKPSGFRVDWYKYIGRSMEHDAIALDEWTRVLRECMESI